MKDNLIALSAISFRQAMTVARELRKAYPGLNHLDVGGKVSHSPLMQALSLGSVKSRKQSLVPNHRWYFKLYSFSSE
jgi:hypothetical protein